MNKSINNGTKCTIFFNELKHRDINKWINVCIFLPLLTLLEGEEYKNIQHR